jgi:hypothetical protein
MDRDTIFTICKSLFITITVAAVVSFFLSSLGVYFLPSFLLVILLQFLGFYFYGEHVKRKNSKIRMQAEVKIAEELTKQQATVTCPCDRNVETTIPIKVNGENKYKCPGCTKEIKVFVVTKTALVTTPTDTIATQYDN